MDIASREYQKLERAYTKFNKELFFNKLPPCFFTYQRKTRALGLFVFESFQEKNSQESISEISLNPDYFKDREDIKILSDLAHEMCHVWQAYCGTPSRSGYHNREWAAKMEKIGLMPSSSGQPGGARTGQKMSDYIIKNHHMFEHHARTLINRGFSVSWASIIGEMKKSSARSSQAEAKNKIKYSCPVCEVNAWGKPGLNLFCGDCEKKLIES